MRLPIGLFFAAALAACAPAADLPDATDEVSTAPRPVLRPTSDFLEPQARGAAQIAEVEAAQTALAARAAALRTRATGLSATPSSGAAPGGAATE